MLRLLDADKILLQADAIFYANRELEEAFTKGPGDIKAVEREVRALLPHVQREWTTAAEEAMAELLAQLDNLRAIGYQIDKEKDDEVLSDFIKALLLSLFLVTDQAAPPTGVTLASVRRMMLAAARAAGLELDFSDRRIYRLMLLASQDLDFWLGSRLRLHEDELRRLLTGFLGLPTDDRAAGRRELLTAVREILQDDDGQKSRLAVDTWAYRTWNIATVGAAFVAGVPSLELFNNFPSGPDGRTTPFCRSVHRLEIQTSEAWQKVTDYYSAVDEGDFEKVKKDGGWLSSEEARAEAPAGAAIVEAFGFPPYHALCRTIVRVRRP